MSHNHAKPQPAPPAREQLRRPPPPIEAPEARASATERWRASVARWKTWFLRSDWMQDFISFQVSLVFHCGLLLLLAVVWLDDREPRGVALTLAPALSDEGPPELLDLAVDTSLLEAQDASDTSEQLLNVAPEAIEIPTPFTEPGLGGQPVHPSEVVEAVPSHDLMLVSQVPTGGGLEGRTQQERARLAAARGGSAESETAVEMGLAWLAAHQRQDGSWRLDHTSGPCDERCQDPGKKLETPIGATGLALLPFLGAGYTHQQGPYREVVDRGLQFLIEEMKDTERGGDLHWDTTVGMYAQGIATLALCEAYGMSGDPELAQPAQQAVDFICNAQHQRGGWRYLPQQPGDTTVTGWQIMALKSARLAHLYVPSPVFERTKTFLNTVQDGRGAFYGYMRSDKASGTTSVGLLLRMYLGWTRQDERLGRGVLYLSNLGPSSSDMYFNYYATQVMHHYEEPYWESWNQELREFLIAQQARDGHERGSWYFFDPHGAVGGRHYTTAICTMILEVYYRYMPLYGEQALDDL